jgi:hypothetical protein
MSHILRAPRATTIFAAGILAATFLVSSSSIGGINGGAVPGFHQFYESVIIKTCSDDQCVIQLDPVPANTLLQATNLFCSAQIQAPQATPVIRISMFQGPLATAKPKENFLVAAGNNSQLSLFTLNQPIRSFFAAGTRPILTTGVDFATSIGLHCKLSGDLVKL